MEQFGEFVLGAVIFGAVVYFMWRKRSTKAERARVVDKVKAKVDSFRK